MVWMATPQAPRLGNSRRGIMNVVYINPFISSTQAVFTTMLASSVTAGTPVVAKSVGGTNVMLAVIGMTGDIRGAVALAFPFQSAVNIANQVLGTSKTEPDADVSDAVAEITNMIAGGAKAQLSRPEGTPVQLGLPVVIRDTNAQLDYPAMASWIVLPFASALGEFTLFVSFEEVHS